MLKMTMDFPTPNYALWYKQQILAFYCISAESTCNSFPDEAPNAGNFDDEIDQRPPIVPVMNTRQIFNEFCEDKSYWLIINRVREKD